jgi:hypothetical protein
MLKIILLGVLAGSSIAVFFLMSGIQDQNVRPWFYILALLTWPIVGLYFLLIFYNTYINKKEHHCSECSETLTPLFSIDGIRTLNKVSMHPKFWNAGYYCKECNYVHSFRLKNLGKFKV